MSVNQLFHDVFLDNDVELVNHIPLYGKNWDIFNYTTTPSGDLWKVKTNYTAKIEKVSSHLCFFAVQPEGVTHPNDYEIYAEMKLDSQAAQETIAVLARAQNGTASNKLKAYAIAMFSTASAVKWGLLKWNDVDISSPSIVTSGTITGYTGDYRYFRFLVQGTAIKGWMGDSEGDPPETSIFDTTDSDLTTGRSGVYGIIEDSTTQARLRTEADDPTVFHVLPLGLPELGTSPTTRMFFDDFLKITPADQPLEDHVPDMGDPWFRITRDGGGIGDLKLKGSSGDQVYYDDLVGGQPGTATYLCDWFLGPPDEDYEVRTYLINDSAVPPSNPQAAYSAVIVRGVDFEELTQGGTFTGYGLLLARLQAGGWMLVVVRWFDSEVTAEATQNPEAVGAPVTLKTQGISYTPGDELYVEMLVQTVAGPSVDITVRWGTGPGAGIQGSFAINDAAAEAIFDIGHVMLLARFRNESTFIGWGNSLEVLGDIFPGVTRLTGDVVAQRNKPRVTRMVGECVAVGPPRINLTRLVGEDVISLTKTRYVTRVVGDCVAQRLKPRVTRLIGETCGTYDISVVGRQVTRVVGEAVASRNMPRVTRLVGEVVASEMTEQMRVSRLVGEVVAPNVGQPLRVTRLIAECVAGTIAFHRVTRVVGEAVAINDELNRVSRLVGEAAWNPSSPFVSSTRLIGECIAQRPANTDLIHLTRVIGECVAFAPEQDVVVPDPSVGIEILFNPNWISAIEIERAFRTDVLQTQEVAEERKGLVPHPLITQTVQITAPRQDDLMQLWQKIQSLGDTEQLVPLYSSRSKVTSDSSGSTINLTDPLHRRFFEGGKAVILQVTSTKDYATPLQWEEVTIVSVTATTLTIEETLSQTYPSGSLVYPLIHVIPNLDNTYELETDEAASAIIQYREKPGPTSLLKTNINSRYTFTGDYFKGQPVLDLRPDSKNRFGVTMRREGREIPVGRGILQQFLGDRPSHVIDLSYQFKSRVDAWSLINFFDWREGRLESFWMIPPDNLFDVLEINPLYIRINPVGSLSKLQQFLKFVVLERQDGLKTVGEVEDITNPDQFWYINFKNPGIRPFGAANLKRATSLLHCRFSSDAMIENWITDEDCLINTSMFEVLNEKSTDIGFGRVNPLVSVRTPADIPNLYFWGDASRENLNFTQGQPPPDDAPIDQWSDVRQPDTGNALPYFRSDQSSPFLGSKKFFYGERRGQLIHPTGVATHEARFPEAGDNPSEWHLNPQGDLWFDNSLGFTIFWHGAFHAGALDSNRLFHRKGVMEWFDSQFVLYETLEGTGPNRHPFLVPDQQSLGPNVHRLYILRWKPTLVKDDEGTPGGSILLWKNGFADAPPFAPIAGLFRGFGLTDLPETTVVSPTDPIDVWDRILVYRTSFQEEADLRGFGFLNSLLIFKRALSQDEVNFVGRFLSTRYSTPWADIGFVPE